MEVGMQSLLWRRQFSHHSCQDLHLQPFNHETGALPTSCPGYPSHSAKSADGTLHLNTHTPLTQWSQESADYAAVQA